jgi:hypothetical protein
MDEQVGSRAVSEPSRVIRRVQTGLFAALFVLSGIVLTVRFITFGPGPFVWGLTPLGSFLLAGLLLMVSLGLAVTLLLSPRGALSVVAVWLGVVVAVALWGIPVALQTLMVTGMVWNGLAALGVASLVGAHGRTKGQVSDITMVLTGIGLLLLTCVLGLALLGAGLGADTTHREQSSPDKRWSLEYYDKDMGGFGGDGVLEVSREFLGVVCQERTLYLGEMGERPQIEWLDERTLLIYGRRFDIYTDAEIDNR